MRKLDTIDKKEISKKSRDGYKKLIFLLAAFLTVILFRTVVMERTIISGNSMYPTLMDSDVCLTAKYRNEPERYDIVVAKVQCHTVIKRVIGLPGETLEVKGGKY